MPNEFHSTGKELNVWRAVGGAVMALMAALALASCSMVRIGYEAVPTYASWRLDRYWALDATQSAYGRDRIAELMRWHRRNELPEYIRWLSRVNERVQSPIDLADAVNWRRDLNEFWTRAVRKIVPELSDLVLTLRTEQVEQMNKRMASENDDYRKEFLPEDLFERETRRTRRIEERIEERIEYFLGPLTERQRGIVRDMASLMPQSEQVWYQERIARQKGLVATIERVRRPGEKVTDVERDETIWQLTKYLLSVWAPNDSQRQKALESAMVASDEITVAVLNAATPAQKAALSRRLSTWARDFEDLAR